MDPWSTKQSAWTETRNAAMADLSRTTFLPPIVDAPKISIVMPARNVAGTLPHALESIRRQTSADWQLLAVDDGSMDQAGPTLESGAPADARLRGLPPAPPGIAAAVPPR